MNYLIAGKWESRDGDVAITYLNDGSAIWMDDNYTLVEGTYSMDASGSEGVMTFSGNNLSRTYNLQVLGSTLYCSYRDMRFSLHKIEGNAGTHPIPSSYARLSRGNGESTVQENRNTSQGKDLPKSKSKRIMISLLSSMIALISMAMLSDAFLFLLPSIATLIIKLKYWKRKAKISFIIGLIYLGVIVIPLIDFTRGSIASLFSPLLMVIAHIIVHFSSD